MVTAVARAWEPTRQSHRPRPVRPRGRGARSGDSGRSAPSRTCSPRRTRSPHRHFRRRSLLVDEAGMASARNLADPTRIATETGAVVRLMGDHQQLASVESGGVLRDLAERVDAPFRSKVHRSASKGKPTPACYCATVTRRRSSSTNGKAGSGPACGTSWRTRCSTPTSPTSKSTRSLSW
ncbi:AAA family ATPase, partial [Rhodococcus koreensis]